MEDSKASAARRSGTETLWETRSDGTNYYQSPEWYRYVGEGEGSSFGGDWLRFYHPDDRELLQSEWQLAVATRGAHVYDVRVRIRRHDGVYRWFRVQGAPVFGADGNVVKWVGTCTEIDDQRSEAVARATDDAEGRSARADGAARPIRRVRFGPPERRLFVIVLSGLMPVTLLASILLVSNARDQKRIVLESAADTMRAVLTAVDGELSATVATLETLASSPRLDRGELAAFHEEVRRTVGARPGLENVFLSTLQGQQTLNGRAAPGSPLPEIVERRSHEAVVQTARPAIGDIVYGPVLKRHVFSVRVPVLRDGGVVHVLSAAVTPEAVLRVILQQRIPDNGVVAVFDTSHRVVARSAGHEQWVGRFGSSGLRELLNASTAAESGWGQTRTLEGRLVYSVFHKSFLSGWTVAVGIPAEAVDGPIVQSYWALTGSTALSLLLGLVLATLLARRITEPLRELETAAHEVGSGRAPTVPRTDLPAVRSAGEALYAAHIEREKALQNERQARHLAEQSNRAKDEFLAMLGHELRNPLNAIRTSAELLQRSDDAKVRTHATTIVARQSSHLGKLTEDLLDAGRVMLGKISLDRRPVDLARIVENEVSTLTGHARTAICQVESILEPVWVHGDATRLAQVVGNLIGNALKFTPPAGKVIVHLARIGDDAVLRIRDTGTGLDPELRHRVFELFVQGKAEADRKGGGLGIGLTLVKRLTELHGGSVEATSEGAGKGSEFLVRLPAIDAPATAFAGAPPAAQRTAGSVVIVEDNEDARSTLKLLLEMDGFLVHEAGDGPSGVETILRVAPDVAIVDVGLPGFDGRTVAREVRRRSTGRVRMIALTGYGQTGSDPAIADFDAYMLKPVDPIELRSMMVRA